MPTKADFTHAPCEGCTKRILGCHASCSDYIIFKIKRDDASKKKRLDQMLRNKSHVRESSGGVLY